MNLIQGWGRPVPEEMRDKIVATWGARAIYTGQYIDLVHDRQTWYTPNHEDAEDQTSVLYEERQAIIRSLAAWIDKEGLPFLRKVSYLLRPDENRVVNMDRGRFHIEASPQSSHGYLYIRAWELKETAVEVGAQ